jgi:hypothetical protein
LLAIVLRQNHLPLARHSNCRAHGSIIAFRAVCRQVSPGCSHESPLLSPNVSSALNSPLNPFNVQPSAFFPLPSAFSLRPYLGSPHTASPKTG